MPRLDSLRNPALRHSRKRGMVCSRTWDVDLAVLPPALATQAVEQPPVLFCFQTARAGREGIAVSDQFVWGFTSLLSHCSGSAVVDRQLRQGIWLSVRSVLSEFSEVPGSRLPGTAHAHHFGPPSLTLSSHESTCSLCAKVVSSLNPRILADFPSPHSPLFMIFLRARH